MAEGGRNPIDGEPAQTNDGVTILLAGGKNGSDPFHPSLGGSETAGAVSCSDYRAITLGFRSTARLPVTQVAQLL